MAQKLKFGNGVWANKEGSTLAYNDENDNYKPLPFTFTRASIATRVNKAGLVEVVGKDQPRIDYTDSADGVLLLEPSRTNIFLYGLNMQDWQGLSGASFQLNNDISPDGTQNATKITYNGTDNGRLEKEVSTSNGTVYTYSVWLKNIDISDPTQIYLGFSQISQGENITITNEWKRYSITVTADGTNEYPRINSDVAGSLLAYGAQFEASNYMTSLIPTSGSAVTRATEVCKDSGNSEVFNDSEGVLFFDGSVLATNENLCISINDGTTSNRVELLWFNDGKFYTQVGNSGQEFISSDTFNNKILIKYGSGSYDLYVNGFRRITDTYTSLAGLNSLDFKRQGSYTFKGKTKELGYYDATLTDSELEYLTSYRSLNELVTELNLNTL